MKSHPHIRTVFMSAAVFGLLATVGPASSAVAQLSGLLSQGLTMTETTTSNNKTTTGTVYFSGNATKRVTAEGRDTILRFDQGKLITIDNKKKTYTEMTFQEMEAMLKQATAGLEQNQEALAAVQKMMGGMMAQITVTPQGPGETIAGYATQKYLITGPMEMEISAAPDLKVPAAYYDAMQIRMPANPLFDMRKMYDAFKQINGWPMKTVMKLKMMGMNTTTTTEVTSVQKGAIPPATFEVPSGYKLVTEK
jgi:Domain of unknown function (DUF4412)